MSEVEESSLPKGCVVGTVRTTENGKKFISFFPDVKIMVGGRELELGKYNMLYFNDAVEDLEFRFKEGYITEEAHAEGLEKIASKNISRILKGKFKVA